MTTPLHFSSKDGVESSSDVLTASVFQLIDDSFGYILSYRVTQTAMMEIKQRAIYQCEAIRSAYDPTLITDLFGQPKELPLQYDVILRYKWKGNLMSRLTITDLEKEQMYMEKNEELNYPQYIAAQRDVEYWSSQGLMNRAVIVRSQYIDHCTWSLTEVFLVVFIHL